MAAAEFPASTFADPSRAQRNLQTIHEMFISSGSNYALKDFSGSFDPLLSASPDPDVVLTGFLRFCEATVSKASLFNDLLKYPVALEVLVKLLGSSRYLADILVRDPELFRWLTASSVLVSRQTKSALADDVRRIENTFGRPERRRDALRRMYRREVLRIGARDVLGIADLGTVTAELSDLADTLIDAACRTAESALQEKCGPVPATPYAVIGLGKLGGGELNYSSDVDLIFVYGEDGEMGAPGKITYHEYFNKFVERIVQTLSQSSGEGHIYRVDLRLRPESGMGSLARSVKSYLHYYEARGDLWERQMLIKGRPVAGDIGFGEKFLAMLAPFIYPRTFFTRPTDAIARIKTRIEKAVAEEENIKLQSGGIRDIEFIVQALQLVNGGREERIRARNTLRTIDALADAGFLSRGEEAALRGAYIFLRTLEHRLQTALNTQTSSIPQTPGDRLILARKMGFLSARELVEEIDRHRGAVREIFDSVVRVRPEEGPVPRAEALVDGGLTDEQMTYVLKQLGFSDPLLARKTFTWMMAGGQAGSRKVLDSRSRELFRQVAGPVFRQISLSASPDLTLNNLGIVAGEISYPAQFFRALAEEKFRRLILTICGMSPRLARGLARDELLLELLASDSPTLSQPWDGKRSRGVSLLRLREREQLRAGIRYVLGVSTFRDFTTEVSRLADEAVSAVYEESCRKHRSRRPLLAVFALGKYGTRELSLDADLDLFFVSGQKKAKASTDAPERIASSVVQMLTRVSGEGKLYDVDVRLRPEGRNAPLVVDKDKYAAYLEQRSSLWERQSLNRLRFVCGDTSLGEGVTHMVASFVYDAPLSPGWGKEVVAMRRKMETRSRTSSSEILDIKLGPGGMVDIEFIAQMIQMRWGREHPPLRFRPTTDVLAAAPSEVLPEREFLRRTYEFYRKIEIMMRLVLEEHGTILPGAGKLDLLARILGFSQQEEFIDRVRQSMKHVRSQFLQISGTLSPFEKT